LYLIVVAGNESRAPSKLVNEFCTQALYFSYSCIFGGNLLKALNANEFDPAFPSKKVVPVHVAMREIEVVKFLITSSHSLKS